MTSLALMLLAVPAVLGQLTNTTLNPNFNNNKCLDVRGDVLANGTPVQMYVSEGYWQTTHLTHSISYDCNGTPAQNWTVTSTTGSTKVQLAGTNFCLDAGSSTSVP